MLKPKYTFEKSERMVLKKAIETLYQEGETLFVYPLKVRYLFIDNNSENILAKVLISVPKKNFKKAVHRNRIKRLIREAYRLNKHNLTLFSNKHLNIHFHYVSKSILSFDHIQSSMIQILNQLSSEKDKK
jgi:ribonuclease P protein component